MADQSEIDAAEERLDKLNRLIERTHAIVAEWGDQPINQFSRDLADLFHDNEDIAKLHGEADREYLELSNTEKPHKVYHPDTGERIA